MAAKKKIWVRHRNLNGKEIALQRKVLSPWAVLFVLPFLFGFGYRWKDWKLLNSKLYAKEKEIAEYVEKIKKLVDECNEIEEDLAREKKDVNESTRQTFGYSAPFQLSVPTNEIPFKNQKWLERPNGDWRKYLNPRAFKGMKGTGKVSTREKVGANDEPRAVRTAYIPEDMSQYKMAVEEGNADFDNVMAYKDPDKNKQQQRKKNRNNQQQQRNRNNQNNQDDDWDDDDDDQ